jgi:hypothetical protein
VRCQHTVDRHDRKEVFRQAGSLRVAVRHLILCDDPAANRFLDWAHPTHTVSLGHYYDSFIRPGIALVMPSFVAASKSIKVCAAAGREMYAIVWNEV